MEDTQGMQGNDKEGVYQPTGPAARTCSCYDGVAPVVVEAVQLAARVLKIVSQYDVRFITPNEMAVLAEKLLRTGGIGRAEYAILSFQPELHGDYDALAGRYPDMAGAPDQPRDFVIEWRAHLEALRREHADPATIELTRELADLVQSFAPAEKQAL